MVTALIIGRFQPFHLGHLRLIEEAAKEADDIIIGIGSSQYSGTEQNPFSAEERRKMIQGSIPEEIKYSVYDIPDIGDDKRWVSHVENLVPEFDVVYTNGPLERRLFSLAGHRVHATGLYNRDKFSGTEIRKKMLEGREWEKLVPEGTRKVIKSLK